MSRGFVKEGDQEEIPMVPPRAYLPDGAANYVTRTGMDQLLEERERLIDERNSLDISHENEYRISVNFINAKLQLLNKRIAEARIVNPEEQPQNEIRFGATVTLKNISAKKNQTFQIVGADEADISKGKISFISPVAKLLINKRAGDKIVLKRNNGDIAYEILDITYI